MNAPPVGEPRAHDRAHGDNARLWQAVDRLLDGAEIEGIRAHKLGALAARFRRQRGRPVAPALAGDERGAAAAVVMAQPLLQTIRSVCDGPLVLFKGPEVAHLYPGSARTFGDVDLLAADPQGAQRALIAAGFVEVDEPEVFLEHHHLRPLRSPTLGLKVELHRSPLWPGTTPPPLDEILERSVPAGVGVDGIAAPEPVHHALLLAGHAWSHDPLRTLRDLVDIAAASVICSERELTQTAAAWGIPKIWQTTRDVFRALFEDRPTTLPLRLWARHLPSVRERTVLDSHLMRWLHVFWELPPRAAVADLRKAARLTLLPTEEDSWREKLARTGRGLRHPRAPMSTHLPSSHEVRRRRTKS
jgi:Uncharacterised nucleotidyltransferase